MIRVAFLIRSLKFGGAQRQLAVLAQGMDRARFDVHIFTFYTEEGLQKTLQEAGVPVTVLHKRSRWDVLHFVTVLVKELRLFRPDVLYSFLPVSNLLAASMKFFFPRVKVIFSVRSAQTDRSSTTRLDGWAKWIEARLALLADRVIANSSKGQQLAVKRGFPANKIEWIPNGFDVQLFQNDREAGAALRQRWLGGQGSLLVGSVGRLHPDKGCADFIQAAAQLAERHPDWRYVIVGSGDAAYQKTLQDQVNALGLQEKLILAGAYADMRAVYNALDIFCLASLAEAFPNVVGEAMACGLPCVVTDVGDAAQIVGDCGRVVLPGEATGLATALESLLDLSVDQRLALGLRARQRILAQYSQEIMITRTQQVFETLVLKRSV